MKTSKLITLDVEIAERLKNHENGSALINSLLREYFEVRHQKNTLFDEKQAVLNQIKQKKKKILGEMKIIKQFNSIGFDHFALNWLRGQIEQPSLDLCGKYIINRGLKMKAEDFVRGWKIMQENNHLIR